MPMRLVVLLTTRAIAAVAIAALPLAAAAQTTSSAQANPAAEHLAAARTALNKVLNAPAPNAEAVKTLSEIKTEYIALEKAASTASPEWAAHYQMIDRLVGELLGPSPSSGVAGAVGTSGTTGGVAANADIAGGLQTFRTELSAFSQAMARVSPASTAAPPSSTAPSSSATAAPAAPPPASTAASASAPSSAADASVLGKLESVSTMLEAALKANADKTSGPVSVDRAMLEQMKLQLDQAKQALKKQ
jgi:hypothetical protein